MTVETEDIDRLRRLAFFRGVPDGLLPWLAADAEKRRVAKSAVIFEQGEPVTHFYIVLSGWVKIFRPRADGTEAVIEVFGPGESFAEAALFMPGGYPASAQAVEEGCVLRIPADSWIDKLRERPELAAAMLSALAAQLKRLAGRIETAGGRTASRRAAEFLLKVCPPGDGGEAPRVRLPYEKHLIANRLGMKPETLSRALAVLRRHGAVVEGRDARIVDREALRRHVS